MCYWVLGATLMATFNVQLIISQNAIHTYIWGTKKSRVIMRGNYQAPTLVLHILGLCVPTYMYAAAQSMSCMYTQEAVQFS